MEALLYLAMGIASDLLVTGYQLCVVRGRVAGASVLSVAIGLLSMYVLARVLVVDPDWWHALAYAMGNGIGCAAVMVLGRKRR